jgi:hypothetical protein
LLLLGVALQIPVQALFLESRDLALNMTHFWDLSGTYFDDAMHLNQPRWLAIDGDSVWIAECYGRRALKYASNDPSTVIMQIGKAWHKNSG